MYFMRVGLYKKVECQVINITSFFCCLQEFSFRKLSVDGVDLTRGHTWKLVTASYYSHFHWKKTLNWNWFVIAPYLACTATHDSDLQGHFKHFHIFCYNFLTEGESKTESKAFVCHSHKKDTYFWGDLLTTSAFSLIFSCTRSTFWDRNALFAWW